MCDFGFAMSFGRSQIPAVYLGDGIIAFQSENLEKIRSVCQWIDFILTRLYIPRQQRGHNNVVG